MPSIDVNINIHEDDEEAVKMTRNGSNRRRTRYVDIKQPIARDAVDEEVGRAEYVTSGGA